MTLPAPDQITDRPTVSVVIPALNEAETIPCVLAEMPSRWVDEVIVVDGGSADGTGAIARDAGARVLIEPLPGYGRACATGLAAARGEIVIFLDGDGADDPKQLGRLLAPILRQEADMVLGSRLGDWRIRGTMPCHQHFGNWLSAAMIRCLYGLALTDLGTFRAVRRGALIDLGMKEMTYGWPTEMIVRGMRQGWRVVEVPVRHRPRLAGRSKISGTLRGTVLAAAHILGTILRHWRADRR
jgi:glycosyltransferase involved in cell wall biosynthesis